MYVHVGEHVSTYVCMYAKAKNQQWMLFSGPIYFNFLRQGLSLT